MFPGTPERRSNEMTTRFVTAAVLLVLIGASAVTVSAQRGPSGAACDKACLQGIADAYLAALVAHDPSKAPMAPNAKFTEQAQPMAVGEGQLWKLTTEGRRPSRFPSPIPIVGQIGLIVVLKAALPPAPPRGGGAGPAPRPRRLVRRPCSWRCVSRCRTGRSPRPSTSSRASRRRRRSPRCRRRVRRFLRRCRRPSACRGARCSSSPTPTTTRSSSATVS